MDNYSVVVSKLDAFIRKYYFNQVLRGSLIFLASVLIFIFILFIGEIYFYFPAVVKITIGIILLLVSGAALIIWVFKPLLSLYKLGPRLQYEDASVIVGKHFPEIKDKLLNVLQLQQSASNTSSLELIQASIEQKAKQISVLPLQQAVNIAKNKKYIPFIAIPIVLFLLGWMILPQSFFNAGNRLLQPSTNFLKPAPFQFILKNDQLEVPMFGNIELQLLLQGDKLPAQVYCRIGNERIEMNTDTIAKFNLLLSRLTANTSIVFEGGGFESLPYEIKVIEQPIIEAVHIELNYPSYIGKKNETLSSLSDWNLPEGTVVNWKLQAKYVQNVQFVLNDSNTYQVQNEQSDWLYQYRFIENTNYQFQFLNKQNKIANKLQYQVSVIKDQHPSLQIKNIADKTFGNQILFVGNASDDYGLSKVQFVYQIEAGNKIIKRIVEPLAISSKQVSNIEHYFDAGIVSLQPGQVLKYFFEAWDNDAINGSKSSRSEIYSYALPVDKALDEAFEKNNQAISKGINQSESQNKKLQQDMQSLQKDLLQSKTMTWQQQQQIEQLAKQQEQLQQKMEEVRKRFEEQQKQADQKNLSQDIQLLN